MFMSSPYSTPNLYCNEVAAEVVSPNADLICDHDVEHESLDFLSYDDSSIISLFDSEIDQMWELESLRHVRGDSGLIIARKDAVNWMLKVIYSSKSI